MTETTAFKKLAKAEVSEDEIKKLEETVYRRVTDKYIKEVDAYGRREVKGDHDCIMSVPNHIAIILDGNGRWAKSKGMPRNYGHVQGSKNVETVCAAAYDLGVKYLTVYAFSTENWNRPKDEVDALMKLLHNYMKTCLKTAAKNKYACPRTRR